MGWYYSQLFIRPPYPAQSFAGQTIIVTGSNVGLGYEAARHFVRLKASKVILAVRNIQAGNAAKRSIEASEGRPNVCEVWALDLASYASVKSFGAQASKLDRLDVVVENAAIATPSFRLVENHESHITVNVISTVLLALLLIPKLLQTGKAFPTAKPHLSIVTSEVHGWTSFAESRTKNIFAALDDPAQTNMAERYGTSKLLEVLVVRELAPRLAQSGLILNMLNPGLCHSALARDSGWDLWFLKLVFARSTEVGSRSLVAAAADGPESHGGYLSDGKLANEALSPFVISAEGFQVQKRVWEELGAILEEIHPGVLRVVE
ncbi:hypothetical protein N7462_009400 [Penicillium macrosclerotiorum]|uniref:uncharacterized protein n=1 Tax=Penicillium macrosclerotiorum TaxID=303699 RepID=UPI002546D78D|nr:uncharacterized protein N7462_009400 [Penicillium macrosclerotiorum]KAJ5673961.1 hypothetical protein N7462_009400 [Penicillium macrosclerotiorum]